jgi:predicted dehydrogenase
MSNSRELTAPGYLLPVANTCGGYILEHRIKARSHQPRAKPVNFPWKSPRRRWLGYPCSNPPKEKMMRSEHSSQSGGEAGGYSRRSFLSGALSAAAAGPLLGAAVTLAAADPVAKADPKRKIKLGVVGCGGRGSWIAGLFKQNPGYEMHAVADYFQETADKCGDGLGVAHGRRFSSLSGYKKVLESGVEAVALEVPPGFFPEMAAAAVEAGVHVYMAKPVAADVPGCLRIGAAGKRATQKQQVFFVDYQIPTDPFNIDVVKRIHSEAMGPLAKMVTVGVSGGHSDPPKTATLESRLHNSVWASDVALSGDWITAFDIHAIDAALWAAGGRPVAATGASRICRSDPHGDARDVCDVIYQYANGLVHTHTGQALPNGADGELDCKVYSETAHAFITYWHKAHFHHRGQPEFTGQVVDLYTAGAVRNIASFYQAVTGGHFENPTVERAVDGCLTCILGREAAARHGRLTMEELLKENKHLELDLTGLKT